MGGATRFFRRHATAAILLYEQGEVRFQLLIEVAIQERTRLPTAGETGAAENCYVLGVQLGPVDGVVGIEGGVVSGVINLESSGVGASDWRPRHEKHYQEV